MVKASFEQFKVPEPLPNESQCPTCGYYDITHPDVQRILRARQVQEYQARCKCSQREEQEKFKEEMRWQQSGILHSTKDFLGFNDSSPGLKQAKQTVQTWALSPSAPIMLLVGQTGSGKSHLLEAVVREILTSGKPARYELVSSIVDRFRHTYSYDSEEDAFGLMSWYQGRYLLALDDLGMERSTDFATELLTRMVEERIHNRYRTIISTNLVKDELAERMGDRLASRLYATNPDLHDVQVVVIDAEDYRMRPG